MKAFLNVLSGGDKLAATGPMRQLFDLTRRVDGYHWSNQFVPFKDVEMFHLMQGDHRAKWVCLAGDGILTRLDAVNGRLHLIKDHDERGTIIMSWERENADVVQSVTISVEMDEPWHETPSLQFQSTFQYNQFMELHDEPVAGILNRLCTAYENDDKTTVFSDLVYVVEGSLKGRLLLVKKFYAVTLILEHVDVYEEIDFHHLHDIPPSSIHFKLFYGQRREPLRTLKAHRLVRSPDPRQDLLVNGREWIPQMGQFVKHDKISDILFITGYDQRNEKFMLQIADPERCSADMIKNRRTTPTPYRAPVNQITPVPFPYLKEEQ